MAASRLPAQLRLDAETGGPARHGRTAPGHTKIGAVARPGAGHALAHPGPAGAANPELPAPVSGRIPTSVTRKRAVAARSGIRRMTLFAVPVLSDAPERLSGGQAGGADGGQQPGQGADDDSRGQAAGPGVRG